MTCDVLTFNDCSTVSKEKKLESGRGNNLCYWHGLAKALAFDSLLRGIVLVPQADSDLLFSFYLVSHSLCDRKANK